MVQLCEWALIASGCEVEMVETEWIRFKTDVFNSKKKIIHSLTWPMLWESMSSDYPSLFKLVSLLLTLPSSSVDAERSFSRMKLQKTDWRACLGDRHLTDLMLISLEGDELEDFNPEPALEIWENSGIRSRRPYFNDKGRQKATLVTQEEENDDIQLVNFDILADQAGALDDTVTSVEDQDDEQYDEQHANDLITLQQKSYRLLLSLMTEHVI
ncbi:uncharacterized protein LOC132728006 [Ruditapes philippinarum]|uniref:uncharacterized protein LOC132728006 n=1 Tax=Ruditapes philippinarum TaxID=129788 RepID=UPI00295C1436|nr:uncharacterized protein LOC132728006 [Ruditapes philippinarum]